MKLTTRNKRQAVAPVLATLLMIAVAVAMSVIIFMWSQGFLSQTSSATGGQQGAQNQAAQSSIAIELATFAPCVSTCSSNTTPQVNIVVRNVGAVAVTLGSLTITGSGSNSGFTGSYSLSSVTTTNTAMTSSDTSCTGGGGAPRAQATTASPGKGASSTITVLAQSACTGSGRIFSGDVVNIKVTTTVGTFAQAQFTVP